MNLLTSALKKEFAKIGSQFDKADPLIIAEFFTPDAQWTWFASEYDEDTRIFYGFVIGLYPEWGSFSLDELQSVRGALGLPVERDRHFEPVPFSEIEERYNL